jgi:hypothetical protein
LSGGEQIVFQFILSSDESHTNFYVFDRIIKLDGPRSAFGDHTSKTDGTEKRVRGSWRKNSFFFSGRAGGDEDENEGKILLVWSVNKTSRKSFHFVSSRAGARGEGKICLSSSESFCSSAFHFS